MLFGLDTILFKTVELNFAPIIEYFKYIAHLQQCQLKICDFSGETFKGFEVL